MRRFVLVLAVICGLAACKKDEGTPAAAGAAAGAAGSAAGAAGSAAAAAGAAAAAQGAAVAAAGAEQAAAAAQMAQNAAAMAQAGAVAAQGAAAAAAAIPRPASITDAHVAAAETLFKTMENAGTALAAAGKDCAKAAAALSGMQKDFDAAQKAFIALGGKVNDDAAEQWIAATYAPRVGAAMAPFMAAAVACAGNAEFQAASEKFELDLDK